MIKMVRGSELTPQRFWECAIVDDEKAEMLKKK